MFDKGNNILAKALALCLTASALFLLHFYCQQSVYLQCIYQQNVNINLKENVISLGHIERHNCSGGNKNDQQEVQLCDKSGHLSQTNGTLIQNNTKVEEAKLSNQAKENVTNIGINATHINGILMEPVNANYSKNIYFTVKTTHKYYTNRLLPLMLTWLQTVDKNKVRYSQQGKICWASLSHFSWFSGVLQKFSREYKGLSLLVLNNEHLWPRQDKSISAHMEIFGCNNLVSYKAATRLKIPWICKVSTLLQLC